MLYYEMFLSWMPVMINNDLPFNDFDQLLQTNIITPVP